MYVDVVEIDAIVFELLEAEISYLKGHVNNTMVYLHVFLGH